MALSILGAVLFSAAVLGSPLNSNATSASNANLTDAEKTVISQLIADLRAELGGIAVEGRHLDVLFLETDLKVFARQLNQFKKEEFYDDYIRAKASDYKKLATETEREESPAPDARMKLATATVEAFCYRVRTEHNVNLTTEFVQRQGTPEQFLEFANSISDFNEKGNLDDFIAKIAKTFRSECGPVPKAEKTVVPEKAGETPSEVVSAFCLDLRSKHSVNIKPRDLRNKLTDRAFDQLAKDISRSKIDGEYGSFLPQAAAVYGAEYGYITDSTGIPKMPPSIRDELKKP